jgi:hypothetical protein
MNLYLAEVEYRIDQYMRASRGTFNAVRLVRAESLDEAREKVRKHYEDKTVEYDCYYTVCDIEITEPII